ncbi:MAG: hypothetical protein HY077_16650 [Elusimicrobia bacterium]|nr:hypothetical protein [Elusimicrobiota bacterium]
MRPAWLLLAAALHAAEPCKPVFSLERLAAALNGGTLSAVQSGRLRGPQMDDLVLGLACAAYAERDPRRCDALRPLRVEIQYQESQKKDLDRPSTLDFPCLSTYYELEEIRAAQTGDAAALAAACEAHERIGHNDFKTRDRRRACLVFARGAADPEGTCRSLAAFETRPAVSRMCVRELLRAMGREDCGRMTEKGDAVGRELCLAAAAWRKARAGDAGDCDAAPLCRALRKEGRHACRSYEERLGLGLCAGS